MLDVDYSNRLAALSAQVRWGVTLPDHMQRFFEESGAQLTTVVGDQRRSVRLKIRTKAILYSEGVLPSVPRDVEPIGVYLADISRYGAGFLSDRQFYPLERVRLILPTCWLSVEAVRANRIGRNCYHIGTELVKKHEISEEAFMMPELAAFNGSES